MKTKTISCLVIFLLLFNCEKVILKNSIAKNSSEITDTVKVTFYPNKMLKEVDLLQFEGDKNVRLNYSDIGI